MIDHDQIERAARRFDPPGDAFERFTERRQRRNRNRRVGNAVVALALVLVALVAAAGAFRLVRHRPIPASKVTPPAVLRGEVAIARGGNANGRPLGALQVYVVGAGGRVTEMTRTPSANNEPIAWSPDGSGLIVQRSFPGNQGQDLFLVPLDGSPEVRLTDDPIYEGEAHYSPDGSRIAFVKDRGIDVMNADGRHVRVLTRRAGSATSSSFSWSPDGTQIAFAGGATNTYTYDTEIYVANADGSGEARLTTHPDRFCEHARGGVWCDRYESPAWSPDGSQIAFVGVSERGATSDEEIFLMRPDGSALTPLTGDAEEPSRCTAPAWSPDGSRLAASCKGGVYAMSPDGSHIQRLAGPGYYGASWSPDGSELGLWKDGREYLVRADGSGLTRLTNGSSREFDTPLWRPST